MNSIFHRTSVRNYTGDPVPEAKIEAILRAAMAAPSAGNQQPWEFYVVTDREAIARLAQASPYAASAARAPLVFVPCVRADAPMPEWTQQDLSAAVENMLLEIDAQGLGGVWMGICPEKDRMANVKAALNLPDGLEAFALIPCGTPAEVKTQQDRYDKARVHFVE